MNLPELLQLERHVESTFAGLLADACENVYRSRQTDSNKTPRISIKAINGGIFQNQKLPIFTAPRWIYSAYQGRVELTIATNRTTEEDTDAHYILIGDVRARCHQHNIETWQNDRAYYAPPVFVFDIREGETSDDVQDTENLDMTKISFNILFSINPTQLPITT